MGSLDPLCEQYKEVGYAVLPGLYSEAQMDRWRHKFIELKDEYDQWWFGNTLEYAPNLFWPAVSHSTILDFAEKVMGPFVQLDNLTLAGSQPVSKEEAEGKVSGWHRDRWGKVPHIYECKALGFWTLIWRMVRPPWTTPAGSSGAPGLASDSCVARGATSRCRLS